MGKSYAFLVLAICLSSTITSCAKTEKNNGTEEVFFAQDNGKQSGSDRDFTDDFIYSMENMEKPSASGTGTGTSTGTGLNSSLVEAYGENFVHTLAYGASSNTRTIRTYTMTQEQEGHHGTFIRRSLTSIKAIVMGK